MQYQNPRRAGTCCRIQNKRESWSVSYRVGGRGPAFRVWRCDAFV